MAEMMVNLRVLRDLKPVLDEQRKNGIEIRRALMAESVVIAEWVHEKINPNWRIVCEVAIEQTPPTCFVAYLVNPADKPINLSKNLIGFACYDIVKKGVFGPSGVCEEFQDSDVATSLLLSCLHSMAAEGYLEASMGWSGTTIGCTTSS